MRATIAYLRARLDERSTWMSILAGVTAAAALAMPWSIVAAIIGVIVALVPDKQPGGPNVL